MRRSCSAHQLVELVDDLARRPRPARQPHVEPCPAAPGAAPSASSTSSAVACTGSCARRRPGHGPSARCPARGGGHSAVPPCSDRRPGTGARRPSTERSGAPARPPQPPTLVDRRADPALPRCTALVARAAAGQTVHTARRARSARAADPVAAGRRDPPVGPDGCSRRHSASWTSGADGGTGVDPTSSTPPSCWPASCARTRSCTPAPSSSVALTVTETEVTVAVTDRGAGPLELHLAQPRQRYGRAASHGRGLALVQRLASTTWGTRHEADGRHVIWFSLARGDRPADPAGPAGPAPDAERVWTTAEQARWLLHVPPALVDRLRARGAGGRAGPPAARAAGRRVGQRGGRRGRRHRRARAHPRRRPVHAPAGRARRRGAAADDRAAARGAARGAPRGRARPPTTRSTPATSPS